MVQIKFVEGDTLTSLERSINSFLAGITAEDLRDISYNLENKTAIIEYVAQEAWKKCLCCDCQHWDGGDDTNSVMGLWQMRGKRKRFNCRACEDFKDVRG